MDQMTREFMMRKIQELEFAAVELNLYLDNFPNHQKALMDYNMYTQQLIQLKKAYEMKYGPLTNFGTAPSQYPWAWINEPWPWEIDKWGGSKSCGSMRRNCSILSVYVAKTLGWRNT